MTDKHEFERTERDQEFESRWRLRLSRSLDKTAGEGVRRRVMEGTDETSPSSTDEDVIEWTRGAIGRLEALVDEERRNEVMTACACQYPRERLEHLRKLYAETKDLGLIHMMLQE